MTKRKVVKPNAEIPENSSLGEFVSVVYEVFEKSKAFRDLMTDLVLDYEDELYETTQGQFNKKTPKVIDRLPVPTVVTPTVTKVVKPPCSRLSITTLSGKDLGWSAQIDQITYRKLWSWWYLCDIEVSGLGLIKFDVNPTPGMKDWKAQIIDASPLSHTLGYDTATSAKLTPQVQADYIMKLIAEEKDPEYAKLGWHSHIEMGCFWSHTDIEDWADACCKEQQMAKVLKSGWITSLVLSGKAHDMEMKLRVDGWTRDGDSIKEWAVDDIPIELPATIYSSAEYDAMIEFGKPETPMYYYGEGKGKSVGMYDNYGQWNDEWNPYGVYPLSEAAKVKSYNPETGVWE